jgi:hypothetical protein
MGVIKECGGKMWMGESKLLIDSGDPQSFILFRAVESSKRGFFRIFSKLRRGWIPATDSGAQVSGFGQYVDRK